MVRCLPGSWESRLPSCESLKWAGETFGRARLGHFARTRRVVRVAAAFADTPAAKVTEANVVSADREAAYRLLENEEIDPENVAKSAFEA